MIFPIKLKLSTFIFIKVLRINLLQIYIHPKIRRCQKNLSMVYFIHEDNSYINKR